MERGEQRTGGRSGGAPAAPRPDDWLSRQLGPDWVEVEPGIFRPPADADEERRRAEPVARAVDDIADSLHAEAAAAGSRHRRRWWRRHSP